MEPLKKLKLTTTYTIKDKHFKQIEARLSKDAPPKPAILPNVLSVVVVLLIIFLAILGPTQEVTTETGITKLYINDKNAPSHSKWYVGVKETTDPKHLKILEQALQSMKPVDQPIYGNDISYTFTVFTGTGQKSYGLISYDQYLLDMDTNQYYSFHDREEYAEKLDSVFWDIGYEKSRIWEFLLLFGWMLLKLIIDKYYYPKDVDGHKLPRHSSSWQSVVWILTIVSIMPVNFFPYLMHYGIIFTIVTLSVLIQVLIEMKTENATWRKWMFLDQYWLIVVIYVIN